MQLAINADNANNTTQSRHIRQKHMSTSRHTPSAQVHNTPSNLIQNTPSALAHAHTLGPPHTCPTAIQPRSTAGTLTAFHTRPSGLRVDINTGRCSGRQSSHHHQQVPRQGGNDDHRAGKTRPTSSIPHCPIAVSLARKAGKAWAHFTLS